MIAQRRRASPPARPLPQLLALPVARRVHSFEVFGTLLASCWWRPEDLFLHLGHRLAGMGMTDEAPEAWARRRAEAEARLRAQGEGAELSAIHALLAREAGQPEETARAAEALEIVCAMEAVRPIRPLRDRVSALRLAGEEVAILADTPLSRDTLCRLLRQAGLPHDPGRVHAAPAADGAARGGRPFARLAGELGIAPGAIRHSGDPAAPGLAAARAMGLAVTPVTLAAPTARERRLFEATAGAAPLLRSAIAGGARAARLSAPAGPAHQALLHATGAAVAGPLLAGFALWALLEAQARGIRQLHVPAPEGQVLVRILGDLSAALGLGMSCTALEAPRAAWHLAAAEGTEELVADLLLLPVTPRAALARAGLTVEAMAPLLVRHGLARALDRPAPASALRALLSDPAATALLADRIGTHRRAALDRLRRCGLLDGGPHGLVETGPQALATRALSRLLALAAREEGRPPPALTGFLPGPCLRPAGLPEEALPSWTGEMAEAARPDPALIGLFTTAGDRAALDWGLPALREGILGFTAELAAALARAPRHRPAEWVAVLRRAALEGLEAFRQDPSPAEALAFGSFPVTAGGIRQDFAPPLGALGRLRLGLGFRGADHAGHWPEASLRRGAGRLTRALARAALVLRGPRRHAG